MTKRFTTLLVITALLLFACGGNASTDFSTSASSPGQGGTPSASGDEIRFDASDTMEETVLVDESDVKITATGLEYKTHAGNGGERTGSGVGEVPFLRFL